MGNCGTREESAVVTNAQVQQLSTLASSVKNGGGERKQNHSRSISDLSDPSTPRNFEDARKNAVLYTHVIAFTLFELETITKSFRSDYILGEGGFGTVYKGYIDENVRVGLKSLPVAVKVLNKEGHQGHREWLTEVNFLGQLRHPNLVKLIGYCCEDDHRLLVYEFMFRGSLENHLFRKATVPLSWGTRMMIALGAAKGLAFLHNAERPVIYRDFKTSNILLDSDYAAKLSDFGLAKAGPQGDETHVSTRVMGTYGYAAPEYVMTGETYEPNLKQSTTTETFHPAGPTEYKLFIDGVTKPNHDTQRRRLAPYQLCLPCKCCSATTCISMPCCFGIDCQLPNKPFGVCAFVPKTCNCTNCTTPA
ncbi:hypothetical protein C1H46_029517 [Malus baccata]|uniref:non-specific serine/threonine protein kinase n=1 Tax=Malus baccata TaxID=106549 RepID=A0A540LEL5_MALBA|nr:hypothetical protein C1H46_029517 [Malus baccata]